MKKLAIIAAVLPLAGCLGHSSEDNQVVAQVKRVQHVTPFLFCGNYDRVDLSLGVIRNGTGSMSKEDVWMWVPSATDYRTLDDAAQNGKLVKITYDVDRMRGMFACEELDHVKRVEVLAGK